MPLITALDQPEAYSQCRVEQQSQGCLSSSDMTDMGQRACPTVDSD